MGTTKVKLTGCYPEKLCLLVILCKCSFAWMSVGGCCPLCPRYLLVLLTLFATSKGFLRVVNSLDLFIRQHICIDGGGFERLVSHQLLGSLNVTSNRLHQNSECMSGAVKRDILLYAHLFGYPLRAASTLALAGR